MSGTGAEVWRIGELAHQSGLTVRTLHHYDEIGLLAPTVRSAAGHRLYGRGDVDRLYRIVALRELGFSLDDIAAVLAETAELGSVLRSHLEQTERRLEALRSLRDRLAVLVVTSEAKEVAADDLLELINEVNTMDEMIKTYFSAEQLATLAQRNQDQAGVLEASRREWPNLVAAVAAHMEAGTDPADPAVQALAARWMELLTEFHGGDPGLRDSLYRMYDENSEAIAQQGGPSPAMIDYIKAANVTTN